MRFSDQTPVMQLGKLSGSIGKLPYTHSISPFMGLGSAALGQLSEADLAKIQPWIIGGITLIGSVVSGIHGYYRNKSIWWGLGWGALGALLPVPVVAYAAGQGLMKKKRRR